MAGKFPEYVYNPLFLADKYEENIGLIDRAAIRADYSHMRKLANQRLKRFEGTEWEKSATYKFNKNRFKKLDSIKSAEELASLIVEVKEFLESSRGSVTGQKRIRREAIETLHERGFTFVNTGNFAQFTQFMQRMRALGLSKIYDSEQTADIWQKMREKGASNADIEKAFTEYSKQEDVRTSGGVSADAVRAFIKKS